MSFLSNYFYYYNVTHQKLELNKVSKIRISDGVKNVTNFCSISIYFTKQFLFE